MTRNVSFVEGKEEEEEKKMAIDLFGDLLAASHNGGHLLRIQFDLFGVFIPRLSIPISRITNFR